MIRLIKNRSCRATRRLLLLLPTIAVLFFLPGTTFADITDGCDFPMVSGSSQNSMYWYVDLTIDGSPDPPPLGTGGVTQLAVYGASGICGRVLWEDFHPSQPNYETSIDCYGYPENSTGPQTDDELTFKVCYDGKTYSGDHLTLTGVGNPAALIPPKYEDTDGIVGYYIQIDVQTTGVPTVSTTSPTSMTSTGASSGGNVTSNGGAEVTARGVCWSKAANPTTGDTCTTDGTGTGTFTSSLTGLTPVTTYYVRAYATNSAGTGYGLDNAFDTGQAEADISITKTVDHATRDVGANVVFTITATNNGPSDATGVVVTDDWPLIGLIYLSDDSEGQYDSGTGVWDIGGLAYGVSAILKITAKVGRTGEIFNDAARTASSPADNNSLNDTGRASLTAAPAPDTPPDILNSSLIGHWKFDETTGTTATDGSGKGNHGTIDGPVYVADPSGELNKALLFDGIDDVVIVPDADVLDITDQLTLSAWIKPLDTETPGYRVIIAKTDENEKNYALIQNGSGLGFFVSLDGSNFGGQLIVDNVLNPNQWVHVTGTYDGEALLLYINGSMLQEESMAYSGVLHTGTAPVTMGHGIIDSMDNLHFQGRMDDVRILTRALTVGDITTLAGFTSVTGKVTRKSDGSPVSDVRVHAWSEGFFAMHDVQTDSSGLYWITGLLPGCYTVAAMPPVDSDYALVQGQHLYVFPSDQEQKSTADFELETGGFAVGGTVTQDGIPVAGVNVRYHSERYMMDDGTVTNDEGIYILKGLPAGRAQIEVWDYGADHDWAFTGANIDINEDMSDFDFELVTGACIDGQVLDTDGNGVAYVRVKYESDLQNVRIDSHTDADGEFTLCNLPPGIGWVHVKPSRESGLAMTFERVIHVEEGTTSDIGTLQLEKGILVEGTVIDTSGEPVTGPWVYSAGLLFETNDRVCYGTYNIVLPSSEREHAIYLETHENIESSPVSALPVSVAVSEDDVANKVVVAAPPMTVYDSGDEGVGFINVSVTGTLPPVGWLRIAAMPQGTFQMEMTPENLMGIGEINSLKVTETGTTYTLGPLPPDANVDVDLILMHDTSEGIETMTILDAQLDIDPGSSTAISFSLPTAVSPKVVGQVFGKNGEIAFDALVIVTDGDGFLSGFTHTNENGHFILYHFPASAEGISYNAHATHPLLTGTPETSFTALENTDTNVSSLHIDITAPDPPDVVSDEAFTDNKTPTWTWSAGGGGIGTFRYQLDSEEGEWVETTGTDFTTETEFGSGEVHVLFVQERDQAGNWSLSGSFGVGTNVEEDFTITSTPIESATEDQSYAYQVTASVENTTFQLDAASAHPDGLSIDETTGLITYLPQTDDEAETYTVIVLATDPLERTDTQTFTLTVDAANDAPSFITTAPVADTPDTLAMPGHVYEFVVEATDEETPGDDLVYSLGASTPESMTIDPFVDPVDSKSKAKILWGPGVDVADTSVEVEVIVSDDDQTDSLTFSIQVLAILVIDPPKIVLIRKNNTDVGESFAVSGGSPYSETPAYYAYELKDETDTNAGSGQILDDGAGNFQYAFSTLGLSEGIYILIVTDSLGFYDTSIIEIIDITVTPVPLDGTIDDPTEETTLSVSEGDLAGMQIIIPADPDRGDFEFKIGTVDSPPDISAPAGIFLDITAKTSDGTDVTFDQPIEITIPYTCTEEEDIITVYTFDEELGRWTPVTDYSVNCTAQTVTFRVNQFSLFTVAPSEIFDDKTISGGINTEDFRMISFPGYPDDPDLVKNLEGVLGPYDDTLWRCAAYNNSTKAYDEVDPTDQKDPTDFAKNHSLEPGRSYWLISRETKQLIAKGLSPDTSKPFDLRIKPGWNMVANPFNESVTLKVSKDGIIFKSPSEATDLIGTDFHKYDPHQDSDTGQTVWYTPMSLETESMTPYEGYWLKNLYPTDITIRFKPFSLVALEKNSLSPFYGKLIRFARRSLHKVMDVVSTTSYADKRSDSQPPPPPATGGADSDAIGNISAGGSGGGCFVDTVTNNGSLVPDSKTMVLFIALVIGLTTVFLVKRRLHTK